MPIQGWSVVWKGDRIQADLVAAVLEADGLTPEVFGDNAYGVGMNFTEARVMVPDDQVETALGLIQEAELHAGEPLDEDDEV